jgi:hypothetical protein
MEQPHDFEKLRADRNAAFQEMLASVAAEHGLDVSALNHNFDPDACYCACAEGGPCEHRFQGWREFEDGCGGETFCARCGTGALSHSLRCGI